ncbi:MAG: TATA-box-binding protein [Candidatus Bathyarchaeia archaeon]
MALELLKAQIQIENVVASATLKHKLNLDVLARALPEGRYDPNHFPGIIYQLRKPKATALIFSSGKIICAGLKSERQAKRILKKIIDELRLSGVVINGEPEIRIQNVVASADLGGTIDLEDAAYLLPKVVYDPEQFPGLIYRMGDPTLTFLVFAGGKVVCAGARSEEDVYTAVAKLEEELRVNELIT